jgi:hypothetical protein
MPDQRDPKRIAYPHHLFLAQGLLMFLTGQVSRHQAKKFFKRSAVAHNLLQGLLDGVNCRGAAVPALACSQTVQTALVRLPSEHLRGAIPTLIKPLIEDRTFDRFRFDHCRDFFQLAIDATEIRSSDTYHCEHCLVDKDKDGTIKRYYHRIVVACIVAPGNIRIPIAWEPVANNAKGEYVKQDCELEAALRLLKALHKLWPRQRFVILGDALYACERVLALCRQYDWNCLITFKEGRMPAIWKTAASKRLRHPENSLADVDEEKRKCRYSWCLDIPQKDHKINTVWLERTEPDGKLTSFAWMTLFTPTESNIKTLINEGARCRQNLEDLFNSLKHRGFSLEHDFGSDGHALDNAVSLRIIAFLILQMTAWSTTTDHLVKLSRAPSPRYLRLYSALDLFGSLKCVIDAFCRAFMARRFDSARFAALETGSWRYGLHTA